MERDIIENISKCKLQLILNKGLYVENIIDKEIYTTVENNLIHKINSLTMDLEVAVA